MINILNYNMNILKNSKSHLINKKQKIKSLKDNHFSKFLNNLTTNPYYNFISYKNNKNKNQSQLFKTKNKEGNEKDSSLKKKKFKSPKYINYHYRFTASQFKNLKLDKETNTNNISFYKSNLKKNDSSFFIKNLITNDIYESNYDPKKISNNFINFNIDKISLKESLRLGNKKAKLDFSPLFSIIVDVCLICLCHSAYDN